MSDKMPVSKIRYSLTKQAWLVLTGVALVAGVVLAYIFVPRLASLKKEKENPASEIRYEIPVSDNLQIPGRLAAPANRQETNNSQFCIQVITPARNPQTGEARDFPTPCDIPEGWEIIMGDQL